MKRSLTLLPLALAACVPASKPPAAVAAPPRAAAAPAPVAAPALGPDWRDWPLTPGEWSYRREPGGSVASFGSGGTGALVSLRCDPAGRRVSVAVAGAPATATLRTSSAERRLPLRAAGDGPAQATASLAAADPLLDALAFSRGRFTVERVGEAPLVVPAHAELGRVAEDCRP